MKVKVIAILEGGLVQNIYCVNPDIELEYSIIDYDLEESGVEGLEDLVETLKTVNEEEKKYQFEPSIESTLSQMENKLKKLKDSENKENC